MKVSHESLKPGDPCPNRSCSGTVYGKEPQRLVRIRGSAPFVAKVYEPERLRCHLCGESFTATPPPGVGEEKFDETVSSMVAVLRYGSGLPMNRIEKLQQSPGVPFPAPLSGLRQWELLRDASQKIEPVYQELMRQAAHGEVLYNDDTPMKILEFLIENNQAQGAR